MRDPMAAAAAKYSGPTASLEEQNTQIFMTDLSRRKSTTGRAGLARPLTHLA
jgi:hypothetical protein